MIISDHLFQLIKSLNKNEKGYFKKFSSLHIRGDENNYIKLFDAIDRQKNYDEKKIILYFKKENFVRHISVVKNYLYNLILKSLESYHSTIDSDLDSMIHQMEILLEKGLYKQCETIIKRAKKTAEKFQKHLHSVKIAQLENNLMTGRSVSFADEKELSDHYSNIFENLNKQKNILEYDLLTSKLFQNLYKRSPDYIYLKKLVQNPLLASEENAKSFFSKVLFYKYYTVHYYVLNNYVKAISCAKSALALLEQNPHQIDENQYLYITTLQHLVICQCKLEKYEESLQNIKKLRNINTVSVRLKNKIFFTVNNEELYVYLHTAQYQEALKLIKVIEDDLSALDSEISNKQHVVRLYYAISVVFIVTENYQSAKKYLGKILNDEISFDIRSDIYCISKILSLIVNFELGNQDLLEYSVKSTYRFLYKRNSLNKFEILIIDFIRKKLPVNRSQKEIIPAFQWLSTEINKILKDPIEKSVLGYFDFLSWINSKIEGRPFAEIAREKQIA
jgi:tetratricopeptide (TPR) repeat protein